MEHSYFDNSEPQVADIYMAYEDGSVSKIDEGKILLPTKAYESGGAGLVSTLNDYKNFASMLLNFGKADKKRIVKKKTFKKLIG